MGPRDLALGAFAVVGLGLLFPLQSVIDEGQAEPMDLVDTLPPPELLSVLALGHRESAADLLEIKITNALAHRMNRASRLEPNELWRLYGAMLTLDPQNEGAAYRGSVYLSSTADSPGRAVQLLAASLGEEDPDHPPDPGARLREPLDPNHPRRWILYHEWAAIYFLMFRQRTTDPERIDYFSRRAGDLWLKCAQQPNGPAWLVDVGRMLVNRGWSQREALEHEVRLWQEHVKAGDSLQKERAEARLKEARCALVGEALQEKVDALAAAGRPVSKLSELPLGAAIKDREHLSDMDPFGVGYFLDQGQVIAPAWYAGKARRSVLDLYEGWKVAFPGRIPTLEDLKIKPLPHLKVTITAEGVEVVPIIPEGR